VDSTPDLDGDDDRGSWDGATLDESLRDGDVTTVTSLAICGDSGKWMANERAEFDLRKRSTKTTALAMTMYNATMMMTDETNFFSLL